jgi:hypothetical protein
MAHYFKNVKIKIPNSTNGGNLNVDYIYKFSFKNLKIISTTILTQQKNSKILINPATQIN